MPNEPAESDFLMREGLSEPYSPEKDRLRATAYPCVERAGVVWTYMGPHTPAPPLPALEWLELAQPQVVASKRVQETNWVQAMEGDIDQSHLSFTHSSLRAEEDPSEDPRIARIRKLDKHPRFEVVRTRYGTCIAAAAASRWIGSFRMISMWLDRWRCDCTSMPSVVTTCFCSSEFASFTRGASRSSRVPTDFPATWSATVGSEPPSLSSIPH